MSNVQTVTLDTIRSLGFASISGTYATVGVSFAQSVRLICFTNGTNGDMFFSDDGSNNKLFIPAGSFKLFDLNTNKMVAAREWTMPRGTQWYVKQSTAPTSGSVYIECLWGQ